MTADIGKVTIPITFSDSEGTSGTKNVEVTVSRIKAPTPVISVNLNPQSQTVDANSTFSSVGTPSNVTLSINEGGSDYTYTTGTVTANKFKITGVSVNK